MRLSIAIALAVLPLAGCSSPTGPTVTDVTGRWAGTITDSLRGEGAITLALAQSDDQVSGRWQTAYPTGEAFEGDVTGTVGAANVSLLLAPAHVPLCPRSATGTAADARLQASYANAAPCAPGGPTGTIRLTRQ